MGRLLLLLSLPAPASLTRADVVEGPGGLYLVRNGTVALRNSGCQLDCRDSKTLSLRDVKPEEIKGLCKLHMHGYDTRSMPY